jgi:hypothetical protein
MLKLVVGLELAEEIFTCLVFEENISFQSDHRSRTDLSITMLLTTCLYSIVILNIMNVRTKIQNQTQIYPNSTNSKPESFGTSLTLTPHF